MGRRNTPMFFQDNPDLMKTFNDYVRTNLDTISSETIHQFLFNLAIPETIKVINDGLHESETPITVSSLLANSGLSKLSVRTVTRWMR